MSAAGSDHRRRSACYAACRIRQDGRDFLERNMIGGGFDERHVRRLAREQIENKSPLAARHWIRVLEVRGGVEPPYVDLQSTT